MLPPSFLVSCVFGCSIILSLFPTWRCDVLHEWFDLALVVRPHVCFEPHWIQHRILLFFDKTSQLQRPLEGGRRSKMGGSHHSGRFVSSQSIFAPISRKRSHSIRKFIFCQSKKHSSVESNIFWLVSVRLLGVWNPCARPVKKSIRTPPDPCKKSPRRPY